MKNSIGLKLTVGITGLILIFLIFLLGMNRFFLEKYYQVQTKKILLLTSKTIDNYNTINEDNVEEMDRIERTKGVKIFIISKDLKSVFEVKKDPEPIRLKEPNFRGGKAKFRMAERMVSAIQRRKNELDEKKFIFQVRLEPDARINNIEIIYKMENGNYLLILKPMVALKESAQIASRFFIISGITTLLLALLFGIIFAGKFTKPIKELNIIAKEMADMNFTKKYAGDETDEIGELGKSINILSENLNVTITELKMANEKLQAEVEHERRLEKMRKEFVSGVSHELKTPVSLIQGYAEGLKYNVNDDDESKAFYCEVIIDEANKMGKMINELLNLAQMEADRNNMQIEKFDISDLAKRTITKFDVLFREKGIKIEEKIEAGIEVNADEGKLEQVMVNYIKNAINHTDDNGKIKIELFKKNGNMVMKVFNEGEHIPEEAMERIWESFYKVDQARSREYGGTGLGLSIVKAAIDRHGGKYGVANLDGGVEFWVEIKL